MPQGTIKKTDPDKKYRRVMSAGTLTGDRVKNPAGDDLGKVKDIMIDIPTGRVAYAVLGYGGWLGIADKLFAVPWNAFTVDEDEHCFVLDMDKEMLRDAPGFDQDNWPDMAEPNFRQQIYKYYGSKPYWDETEDVKTFRGGGGGL